MSPARRAGAVAVLLALAVVLVGGGLLFVLGRDDETAAPGGPLGSVLAGAPPATAPFTGLNEKSEPNFPLNSPFALHKLGMHS